MRIADREPEAERHREPEADPPQRGAVDEADRPVGDEVGRVAALVRALRVQEQPADVRVGEAAQRAAQAVAVVDVRAVRIALEVGERMVLAVVGDPRGDRALDRHRPHDRERRAQRPARRERAVREVTMKADGDAEAGDDVHQREHDEVVPVQEVRPCLPDDKPQREHRDDRDDARRDAVGRLVRAQLDVLRGRGAVARSDRVVTGRVVGRRPGILHARGALHRFPFVCGESPGRSDRGAREPTVTVRA
jgi:hypothetical protein